VTPVQYRDALTHLGLTQVAAGRLLGASDRTSRRWARNGAHGAAVILLRLLLAVGRGKAERWTWDRTTGHSPRLGRRSAVEGLFRSGRDFSATSAWGPAACSGRARPRPRWRAGHYRKCEAGSARRLRSAGAQGQRWRVSGLKSPQVAAQLVPQIYRRGAGPEHSHSCNFDQRRRPEMLRTAMAAAFLCPTSTTSRLPRVTPV
jgi:hypothetical protein